MEDFQPQWVFEAEKFTTGFLAPNLPFPGAQAAHKGRQYEAYEGNIGLTDQLMRPNLKLFEPMNMMRLNKDDEFSIGSPASPKAEHQEPNQQYQPVNVNQSQLEMFMEPAYAMKPQDFNLDFYQIRRSRGPSFNISRDRKGSEDFFNTNFDFMRLFRNFGEQDNEAPIDFVKAEYDPTFGGNAEKAPLTYSYSDVLPQSKTTNYDDEDKPGQGTSEEMGADESTLQESVQESEHSLENNIVMNELETAPVTKKKRKTNNNVVITEPVAQKKRPYKPLLKKSKSENKSAAYSLTIPKGNSFSLKITKMPEPTEQEGSALPTPKSKKQSSKTSATDPVMAKIKTEEGQSSNENTNEAPQGATSCGKSEATNPLVRSNSSILSSLFQGKNPGSIGDLVAGLGLPAEVEELLNSSKLFSNFQLSSTKKIGPLTVEERKAKVEKYLEKRKNRTWCKKINYDCRKRVADSRLRFKGRFVTKTQAFAMLEEEGIYPDQNKITEAEIKSLLEQRFGSDPVKKKEKEGDGRKNNGRPKKAKQEVNVKNEEEWYGMGKSDEGSKSDEDDSSDDS